jgi:hypothetical protein
MCRTRRNRTNHLLLHIHAPSAMMPRAPHVVASSPVLRQNWKTLAQLASRRSKPSDVDACPHTIFIGTSVLRRKPTNLVPLGFENQRNHRGGFVSQITKPQLSVLRTKMGNPSEWFWGQNTRTVTTDFEAKPGKTIDLGFEAKLRNSRSLSPSVRCRPHIPSPDLSIVQPSSIRPVLDYSWSSAPSFLLLPRSSSLSTIPHMSSTHHEISKRVSPHEIDSRMESPKFLKFKFKSR